MIDVSGEIQSLAELLPSVKKVAIIFNPAEINSLTQSKQMIDELIKRNIEPIEIGIQSETDIPAALNNALRKADALLAPTDNLVASAITLIANQARAAKKPLIVSDNLLVTHGALMSRGIDYEESGRETARIAYDVLVNKQESAKIPVVPTQTNTVFINKKVMHNLNITIPENMKDSVKIVE
jgi:putative ABC transport system substrate-binding protein